MRVLHVAAGIDVEPQKKPTIRAVASSHGQIYGSSGLDESISTTEMDWHGWAFTSFQLRHEGVRSSPQPIGYSVAAGIRDGWHAGRRYCTTRYSDRLAGREHLRHWSRAM
jgi:hypothetical protein